MTPPIQKKNGFRILSSDENALPEFEKIRQLIRERKGVVLAEKMNSNRPRLVLKAEFANKSVILKQEFFQFRFDRSLKAFLFGSDAFSIFKISQRAHAHGFTGIPQMFLAAERFRCGILRESISVFEFLEGNHLAVSLTPEKREELSTLMRRCHENGIISGDICPDNFIETPSGLKLIDFRGNKIFQTLSKARERLQLKRIFGIPNPQHGIAEKIFLFQNTLRNLGKRLRGKEPSPD